MHHLIQNRCDVVLQGSSTTMPWCCLDYFLASNHLKVYNPPPSTLSWSILRRSEPLMSVKSSLRKCRATSSAFCTSVFSSAVRDGAKEAKLPDQNTSVTSAALAVMLWLIPCRSAHSQARQSFTSPRVLDLLLLMFSIKVNISALQSY